MEAQKEAGTTTVKLGAGTVCGRSWHPATVADSFALLSDRPAHDARPAHHAGPRE